MELSRVLRLVAVLQSTEKGWFLGGCSMQSIVFVWFIRLMGKGPGVLPGLSASGSIVGGGGELIGNLQEGD